MSDDEWSYVSSKEQPPKRFCSYEFDDNTFHLGVHFNEFSCVECGKNPHSRKGKISQPPRVLVEKNWENGHVECPREIPVCSKHSKVLTSRPCDGCDRLFHSWKDDNEDCCMSCLTHYSYLLPSTSDARKILSSSLKTREMSLK